MLIMHKYFPRFPEGAFNVEMHMSLGQYAVEIWHVNDAADLKRVFHEPCTDIEDATELFAIKVNEYNG